MELTVISPDPELNQLCREVFAEVVGSGAAVRSVAPADYYDRSGLCVWEFCPTTLLPTAILEEPFRHLFVVDQNDLSSFYEQAGHATVLLKPVTRTTLGAFVSFAASRVHAPGTSAESLRADRDDILQCLIQTNLKLQEYDQGRTNFIARTMHDFRAPLTALCGYCDFLLAEPLGALNDEQKEVLRRMLHSARRLSRLASCMLQLNTGPRAKPRSDLRKANLQQCVEQALHEIAPFAEEKRHAITVDLSPSVESLYFEPNQIEQVLVNLMDNACKFTPKAGSIDVRGYPYFWDRRRQSGTSLPQERRLASSSEPNAYRVDVHDSGIGIPQERLSAVFEEYVSYSGPAARSSTGIGLAICRTIVTQHEGAIWVENSTSGPTFSFVLPFHSSQSLADRRLGKACSEVA